MYTVPFLCTSGIASLFLCNFCKLFYFLCIYMYILLFLVVYDAFIVHYRYTILGTLFYVGLNLMEAVTFNIAVIYFNNKIIQRSTK